MTARPIPRPLEYKELTAIWNELALLEHWNQNIDFYCQQIDKLHLVLADTHATAVPRVAIENLEVVWYYSIRHYDPLLIYIEKKIEGRAGKLGKNVDTDHAIWAFATESVELAP